MSTIDDKKNKLSHVEFINRVNLLSKFLKLQNIDTEKVPGINRASKSSYKTKGKLPSYSTLESLASEHNINLNWLLLGEGEMLRRDTSASNNKAQSQEQELSKLKDENLRLAKEVIEAKEEALQLYRTLHAKESS